MQHLSAEMLAMTTGDIADNSKTIFSLITGGALAIAAVAKAVTKIEQGEVGIRTRFGKPTRKDGSYRELVGPGIHFAAPFTHSIKRISLQDRVSKLERITTELPDADTRQRQIIVQSTAIWGVSTAGDSVFRAAYVANNEKELEKVVVGIASQGLRRSIGKLSLEQARLVSDMTQDVAEECSYELAAYGVDLRRVTIASVSRSASEVLLGNNSMTSPFPLTSVTDVA